jgi:PEGA domain-containing protein
MKTLIIFLAAGLASGFAADTKVEQSTTALPTHVETHTYQQDGKTVTERITTSRVKDTEVVSRIPHTYKAAIFISNHLGPKMEDQMDAFEDLVTARVTDLGFQVLSKGIVSDSLRKFDSAIASSPRPADSLDTKLSEQSSALRLAQGLGADYLLVASLVSLGSKERTVDAYGVNAVYSDSTLRVTYKVIDGQTGATITADAAKVVNSSRRTANSMEKTDDTFNELMDEAAVKIAGSLNGKISHDRITAPSAAAALVTLNIDVEAADVMIPDVRISEEHTVSISDSKYKVHPLNAVVEVDGVAMGTAPGPINLKPGFSKLRISREGFKPWERTINAVNGATITIALEMSDAGYARWRDATAFINHLKNGAKLTDAEVEVLHGQAKMLSQSGFKVDTKNAPVTNIFR